jgi:hypothetical protein
MAIVDFSLKLNPCTHLKEALGGSDIGFFVDLEKFPLQLAINYLEKVA